MVNDIQLKAEKMIAQCHDAVVAVVHQTLLQDHPGVLWEQGIVSSDQSHTGNIYHPIFH